jgi:hypothetical protein
LHFQLDVIRKYFKAIYVVDVSPSLLEVAHRRVAAANLGHIVHIVEHDFTSPTIFKQIAHMEGKVDMVRPLPSLHPYTIPSCPRPLPFCSPLLAGTDSLSAISPL